MFKIHKKEIEWGGRKLTIETGKIARQADGSALVTYGETTVMATVVADKEPRVGLDFFPLTVNYQEKYYAAGKIPGGFLKRESRPSDDEVLISRLIDRPIRPLFVKGFKCETQVINTVLSYDMENDPDIVALVATSAALTISGIPFLGPIAAARVGYKKGEYILNTLKDDKADSDLDMVVAGTADAVLMVESEANELSEEVMLGAVLFAQENFRPVIDAIIDLAEDCAKEPRQLIEVDSSDLAKEVTSIAEDDLRDAYEEADKMKRHEKISEIKNKVKEALVPGDASPDHAVLVQELFKDVEKSIVRGNILNTKQRIDGRDLTTVRPINIEVGILPRSHGSALFTRGETQALVLTTLGTGEDEKMIESLHGTYKQNFMLHYNFPPFSVGETGRVGAPGRREIGHGKLAWRSLSAVLPNSDEFPYTTRIVSEITESNGSSSMATVCGSSLSMMDAGVPIKAPVAGVAMGLIKEEDDYVVLTDILGDEDHLGDMDFKVAGTEKGVTALQMDIKITGITRDIMKVALEQAHDGRIHILNEMKKVIGHARSELGEYAPKIKQITIPEDKIREVIGTGGKVIRQLVEETGAKIDISDDGKVKIASNSDESINAALKRIEAITAVPEVGMVYHGKVAKIMEFGAFVNYIGNNDGLVHISQLNNERVNNVEDVVKEGDMVYVKLLSVDDRGKVRLSMKMVNQKTGEDISDQFPPDVPPSSKPRRHNNKR